MSAIGLLRKTSVFSDLPEHDLVALSGCLHKHTFAKGIVIFHKDSPANPFT